MLATVTFWVIWVRLAQGDIYMHSPRGSNNRLAEQSANVNNNKRLFDSQNNNNGGYPVGDNCVPNCLNGATYDATKPGAGKGVMYYYSGSELPIQWTMQHSCGHPLKNAHCQVIIQYLLDSDIERAFGADSGRLRDGLPPNGEGNAGGQNKKDEGIGLHENFKYYEMCSERERNKGLYTSDQRMKKTDRATNTRQNPQGTKHGLECPEERDYYPYWAPTPFRDIAILTSDPQLCDELKLDSQNVKDKGHCIMPRNQTSNGDAMAPIDEKQCRDKGYSWEIVKSWGIDAPECLALPEGIDNHLGNIETNRMATYTWKVPKVKAEDRAIIRIRYNITTSDLDREGEGDFGTFTHVSAKDNANPPLKNNPVKDYLQLGEGMSSALQLQVNTAQYGRTFQDRSHMFNIKPATGKCKGRRIVNFNVMGKRGNIVQVYPAVEYAFTPHNPVLYKGDCLHFQWTGSDANPQNRDGNGRRGTDRSNVLQVSGVGKNEPERYNEELFLGSRELHSKLASPDHSTARCSSAERDDNKDDNCAQLNHVPAYFDGGAVRMSECGTHHVISTRNNDFSNRSQKSVITVECGGKFSLLTLMILLMLALFLGWLIHSIIDARRVLKNPYSSEFSKRNRPWILMAPCFKSAVAEREQQRRQMVHAILERRKFTKSGKFVCLDVSDPDGEVKCAEPVATNRCGACCVHFCSRIGLCVGKDGTDRRSVLWYFVLNLIVFLIGAGLNWDGGFSKWFALAKGGGNMLDLNLVVVIFPAMRNLQPFFNRVRQLDSLFNSDPMRFHITVACFIFVGLVIHISGHILHMNDVVASPKFLTPVTERQKMSGRTWRELWGEWPYRYLSGVFITQCFLAMSITALPCIRRRNFSVLRMREWKACLLLILTILIMLPWSLVAILFWLLKNRKVCCSKLQAVVGGFEIFWSVHMLWIPMYVIMFLHGKNFYMWATIPCLLLLCDKLIRDRTRKQAIVLTSAELHFGPVLKLYFSIPENFYYQAGQYVRLCCEEVSSSEWHPFTITSAPEEDFLLLTIRCPDNLDWCSALRQKVIEVPVASLSDNKAVAAPGARVVYATPDVKDESSPPSFVTPSRLENVEEVDGADRKGSYEGLRFSLQKVIELIPIKTMNEEESSSNKSSMDRTTDSVVSLEDLLRPSVKPINALTFRIDGPHGTPSELVWNQRVVMLVGAGIGVTPFASILRSLQLKLENAGRTVCQKVYLFWLCREQAEFFWFYDLLKAALTGAVQEIVVVHLFQTGGIEICDLVPLDCGAFRQFLGRPNWNRLLPQIAADHPGASIGVFCCGPSAIRAEVENTAKHNPDIEKFATKFTFHSESF